MVIQGHGTTVPVTLEDVIYHCKAVSRGLYRPFLMADMPFMTYASPDQALNNAVRLMQEGGAKMVKLEGGASQAAIVEFLANHDIAVCAHLGLKPQSVHKAGGFRVQGRDEAAAEQMRHDAKLLESAGADFVLLECIPSRWAQITAELHVPVIGIGAVRIRTADTGVVRPAGYYQRSQAAFCQELHGRHRQPAPGVKNCASGARQVLSCA
jgi:3-methyl-2-oxobutanoate hydroxymethyltransferase